MPLLRTEYHFASTTSANAPLRKLSAFCFYPWSLGISSTAPRPWWKPTASMEPSVTCFRNSTRTASGTQWLFFENHAFRRVQLRNPRQETSGHYSRLRNMACRALSTPMFKPLSKNPRQYNVVSSTLKYKGSVGAYKG